MHFWLKNYSDVDFFKALIAGYAYFWWKKFGACGRKIWITKDAVFS